MVNEQCSTFWHTFPALRFAQGALSRDFANTFNQMCQYRRVFACRHACPCCEQPPELQLRCEFMARLVLRYPSLRSAPCSWSWPAWDKAPDGVLTGPACRHTTAYRCLECHVEFLRRSVIFQEETGLTWEWDEQRGHWWTTTKDPEWRDVSKCSLLSQDDVEAIVAYLRCSKDKCRAEKVIGCSGKLY